MIKRLDEKGKWSKTSFISFDEIMDCHGVRPIGVKHSENVLVTIEPTISSGYGFQVGVYKKNNKRR